MDFLTLVDVTIVHDDNAVQTGIWVGERHLYER